jgi:hypothetical protein
MRVVKEGKSDPAQAEVKLKGPLQHGAVSKKIKNKK